MPESGSHVKRHLRLLALVSGLALLAYLVTHVGVDKLVDNARTIGWGILLVLGLAGISHVIKTWAWRLTAAGELDKVSFVRTFGLRLAGEALGQLGVAGQMVGDGTRASLLGSEVETSSAISSVALDRGLFMLSGVIVMLVGLLALLFVPSAPRALRICCGITAIVLFVLLFLATQAVRKGWPVLSGTARVFGHLPGLKGWLQRKESVILSAEQQMLRFHTRAPRAFWMSVFLNFVAHALAIAEVYLILVLMGSKVSAVVALMLESLTKLINSIGGLIPGTVGAYEGGNMAMVKLVGLSASQGLTLGLCRRFRAIVWAIIGGIWLMFLSRSTRALQGRESRPKEQESKMPTEGVGQSHQSSPSKVAIVLANQQSPERDSAKSALAKVGTLPLALRAILSVKSAGADRILVGVDPESADLIRRTLAKTRRLPDSVEWIEVAPENAVTTALRQAANFAERVVIVEANSSYQPSLYRRVCESSMEGDVIELASNGEMLGLVAISGDLAQHLTKNVESRIGNVQDLDAWSRCHTAAHQGPIRVFCEDVPPDTWQLVANEQDREAAEKKLDGWLMKPTDGIFARMNRRVSIPISHQLIKFPISPNMVSLFTLGVSFLSGVYFALGGYWNTVIGAALSLWASILDGCDGEVARIKLQSTPFGCWLDTACDYLYYLFMFAGMTIGLVRSTRRGSFYVWGAALFVGAMLTFIVASHGRQKLSGERPEQYLAVWQKKAEKHLTNPLIYIGRYTEFIVRRCFLPYAILVLAVLNLLPATLRMAAIGANVAWIISLRSHIAFSAKRSSGMPASVSNQSAVESLVV
jgi:uncharacterized protein (TIRG00374 family)